MYACFQYLIIQMNHDQSEIYLIYKCESLHNKNSLSLKNSSLVKLKSILIIVSQTPPSSLASSFLKSFCYEIPHALIWIINLFTIYCFINKCFINSSNIIN